MIQSNYGNAKMHGSKYLLELEFEAIVAGLYKSGTFSKKELKSFFKEGLKSDGKINQECVKNHDELDEVFKNLISKRTRKVEDNDGTTVENIFEDNKAKMGIITLNTKGKTGEEIGNEISKILKEMYEEGEKEDDF